MTAPLFVQTLVFAWMAKAQSSLAEMAQMAAMLGVSISPQGIAHRFSEDAAQLLKVVLQTMLLTSANNTTICRIALLERFTGIYLFDSTVIALPDDLAPLWKGCGGRVEQGSASALKVQTVFEIGKGTIQGTLEHGKGTDQSAPTQHWGLPPGSLKVADLGYFSLDVLAKLSKDEVYWLTRILVTTLISLLGQAPQTLVEIANQLRQEGAQVVDIAICLGKTHRLPCRLLGVRLPENVAEARRRKLHAEAKKKGQTVSQSRLALADWNFYGTHASVSQLSLDEGLVLARSRWQIELLFKRWKSQGEVDVWRTEHSSRILCEVYAKLIAQLLEQGIFCVSCWSDGNRSLLKAGQTVQKMAMGLASAFGKLSSFCQVLLDIGHCIGQGCQMNPRKKHPNNYQLLEAIPPLGGLA